MTKKLIIFCFLLAGSIQTSGQKGMVVNNSKVIVANGAILSVSGAADGDIFLTNNGKLAIDGDVYLTGDLTNNGQSELGDGEGTYIGSILLKGSTEQRLGGNKVSKFEDLIINNSGTAGIILDTAILVGNELNFTDGIMFSSTNHPVRFDISASALNHSDISFVDGPAEKIGNGDFIFPTGDGIVWAPLGITGLSGDAATVFTAEYFFSTYSDVTTFKNPDPNGILNNVSTLEYWNLTNTGTSSNANLTLYWKNQSRSEIDDYVDLKIAHYTGTEWENLGQSNVTGSDPGSITVNNLSSFSPFTFGSLSTSLNPLPVTLLSFDGKQKEDYVELNWTTSREINNDLFVIERGEDIERFETIGEIAGEGNSQNQTNYDFFDLFPFAGINYYRLKQIDFDGSFEYSKIIVIDVKIANPRFVVYPNPVINDILNIKTDNIDSFENLQIDIYSINGNLVKSFRINTEEIYNEFIQVSTKDIISSGLYYLIFKIGDLTKTAKIALVR